MLLPRCPDRRLASVHLSYNQQPHFDRAVLLFDAAVVQLDDRFVLTVDGRRVVEPDEGEIADQSRPALEVAEVFCDHAQAWCRAHAGHISLGQLEVMPAIGLRRETIGSGPRQRCDGGMRLSATRHCGPGTAFVGPP